MTTAITDPHLVVGTLKSEESSVKIIVYQNCELGIISTIRGQTLIQDIAIDEAQALQLILDTAIKLALKLKG